uniref:Uncharacterized protein n=1 Tax=Acrobeloides nanus TaxID=290746 RepID=A0A914DD51_9BILA
MEFLPKAIPPSEFSSKLLQEKKILLVDGLLHGMSVPSDVPRCKNAKAIAGAICATIGLEERFSVKNNDTQEDVVMTLGILLKEFWYFVENLFISSNFTNFSRPYDKRTKPIKNLLASVDGFFKFDLPLISFQHDVVLNCNLDNAPKYQHNVLLSPKDSYTYPHVDHDDMAIYNYQLVGEKV